MQEGIYLCKIALTTLKNRNCPGCYQLSTIWSRVQIIQNSNSIQTEHLFGLGMPLCELGVGMGAEQKQDTAS